MNLLSVLVGLLLAVVVYLVLAQILTFSLGALVAGLAALAVFCAVSFGGAGFYGRWRR